MKKLLIIIGLMISCSAFAQLLEEQNFPGIKYQLQRWKASWVTCYDIPEADYQVVMFRKTFELKQKPKQFVVHISADNRYKLYVNGKLASIGPQLSDWRHWRYETVDLAPYLMEGQNTLAAEVVNWGPDRFFGIMSIRTAFMMQGEGDMEQVVNTSASGGWKAMPNKSYSPKHPNWIFNVDITDFYATNPGDSVHLYHYPEKWTEASFNDADWKPTKWLWNISNENEGGFYWLLKPRTTPQVVQHKMRFPKIVRTEGIPFRKDMFDGKTEVVISPQTKATILLDYGTETIGFPELLLSGGKDAQVSIRYSENLFNKDLSRGDRAETGGKFIRGLRDIIIADGRNQFLFSPLWYRAFRYVQIDVEAKSEKLILHDYYNMATASPMPERGKFTCDNPVYMKIDEICRRTAAICTQDNLMSDAYYEQMMYVGDSRVHALVNLYISGQNIWLRNAIEQFDYSRMPDGNITSCYPLKSTFVHPTFTLVWVDMLHDFMMYCNDRQFIAQYVQSVRNSLAWFERNLQPNGLVGKPAGSYFVDWYSEDAFAGVGIYPASANGNSAVVTLHYAATLIRASELFEYLGLKGEAIAYRNQAEKVKQDVITACWDSARQLFAENPDKQFFDERANIMAIAALALDADGQRKLFARCIDDKTISKPAYYFRFNHFVEMRRLGMGEYLDNVLDIWKDLLPLHLTTTPERIARQRSDAHPWSASPSMAFINVVAGITPAEPEYKSVSIEPSLGTLNSVKATYPHYLGDINIDLKKTKDNGIEGMIELPKGLRGVFKFKDKITGLNDGVQKIKF